MNFENIQKEDKEIYDLIEKELKREENVVFWQDQLVIIYLS